MSLSVSDVRDIAELVVRDVNRDNYQIEDQLRKQISELRNELYALAQHLSLDIYTGNRAVSVTSYGDETSPSSAE